MKNNLETVRDLLETELILKRKVRNFSYHDKSITYEDITNECWIRLEEENLDATVDNILKVLKNYFKTIRNNNHCGLMEEVFEIEEEKSIDEDLEEEMLRFSSTLNLSEREQLVLLYLQNKLNLKKYDYSFILRKNKTGIDPVKINYYLISINNKIMTKMRDDFIKKYNKGEEINVT